MAPLSLSTKASASRLTRLSGLSHGTKPSKCRILQCETLSLVMLGLAEINSVDFASKMSFSPVMVVLGVLAAIIMSEWNIAFVQTFINV